jgi:methyl-accepting chemotaxis protein
MKAWHNLPIAAKIIIIGTGIIAVFSLVIFVYLLPKMEESIFAKKEEKLKDIVASVYAYADKLNADAVSGKITLEEAQTRTADMARSVRYGDDNKDYIWINDYFPKIIVHPFSPELEGKDVTSVTDKNPDNPIYLFQEFAKIALTDAKSGFVTYTWQWKDDPTKTVPKISYVKAFEPWKWVIGTGIYIEDFKAEIFTLKRNLIIISVSTMLVTLIFLFLFSRAITGGITLLESKIRLLQSGDLTLRLSSRYEDEIGRMITSFSELTRHMREIIIEVINTVETLSSSSVEMSASADTFAKSSQQQAASSEEITATIEQISGGVENISAEVSGQLENVGAIQKQITSLNGELGDINAQIQSTKNLATEMSTVAKAGENSLRLMSDNMSNINSSSQEMKNIIGIINDISDRINLLSLNASIEAARAGDAGRGFAVVADEISKLAEQTAQSIKEIGKRIKENETEIGKFSSNAEDVIQLLNSIVEGVIQINGMTDKVATTMLSGLSANTRILEDFAGFKKRAEMITTATGEQKIAMDEMVKTVADIAGTAQHTASTSEEIAASAGDLANIAETLKGKVEFFKVK